MKQARISQPQIEEQILALLAKRGAGKSICPSEVARALAEGAERAAWKPLMPPVRTAAEQLAAAGQIVFTQRGQVVEPATAKGAIRLRSADL